MSKVLVTGGSGFIGSHVVDKLRDAGHTPLIYDLNASPHHGEGEIKTVIGDLHDTEALAAAMEGCSAAIHLAAAADVGIVAEHPVASEDVNARGTLCVLEAARKAKLPRVVYGSTIWVYGESGEGIVDEESALGMPKHLYTASKLAGEMYCSSYAELYDVPFTILRFGIPYGPRARPAAVIPIFVRKALAGEPLTIAGDGMQTRRFVYVEDLAEGIVAGLADCADGRIYNLAGTETVTIKELAETVGEVVGDTDIVHTPGRSGDFGGAEISSVRADRELDWRADTPLKEGVRRYVDWLGIKPEAMPACPVVAKSEAAAAAAAAPADAPPAAAPLLAGTAHRTYDAVRAQLAAGLGTVLGVVFAYLLASRFDQFSSDQAHTAMLTTFIAIPLALIWGLFQARKPMQAFLWLTAAYIVVLALPWSRSVLDLATPSAATLALSSAVTLTIFGFAYVANRVRSEEETASEEV
jgi:UDP-glucose 4-epimerase